MEILYNYGINVNIKDIDDSDDFKLPKIAKKEFDWEKNLTKTRETFINKQIEERSKHWRHQSRIDQSSTKHVKSTKKLKPMKNHAQRVSLMSRALSKSKTHTNLLQNRNNNDKNNKIKNKLKQQKDRNSRSKSDSFETKEAYYLSKSNVFNSNQFSQKMELKCDQETALKKYILNKTHSNSVTMNAKITNWETSLRTGHHVNLLFDPSKPRMKPNMTIDINNNKLAQRMRHKKVNKANNNNINKKKDAIKVKNAKLRKKHASSSDELRLLKIQSAQWSNKRGFVDSTVLPVHRNDFHHLFQAFEIASKKRRSNEASISDKEIYKICTRLNLPISETEAKKMADIYDKDGSKNVTFSEMVNVMNQEKQTNSETFLGAGITLEHLLIANKRRSMLDKILKSDKKHTLLNMNLSDYYAKYTKNNNNNNDKDGSSNNNNIDTSSISAFVEHIEADAYIRTKHHFSGDTRNAYICQYCDIEFEYSHTYESHILEKHKYNDEYFTCYQCGQQWISMLDKHDHIMQHKIGQQNISNSMYLPNGNASQIDSNNNNNINKNNIDINGTNNKDHFKCKYCKLVFPSREVLAYHNKNNHYPLTLDIFQCTYCHDSFDTTNNLKTHIKCVHFGMKNKVQFGINGVINNKNDKNNKNGNNSDMYDTSYILDDYDSDNDMTPEEFNEMRQSYYESLSRKDIKHRVNHLGYILDFRDKYDIVNNNVDSLKQKFDTQDNSHKIKNVRSVTSLLTSKFSEIVTEDLTGSYSNTYSNSNTVTLDTLLDQGSQVLAY